jgi:hypothetical protein
LAMLAAQRAGNRLMPEEKPGQAIVRKCAANLIRGPHDTRCRSFNLLQSERNMKSYNPSDGYWEGLLELYKGRVAGRINRAADAPRPRLLRRADAASPGWTTVRRRTFCRARCRTIAEPTLPRCAAIQTRLSAIILPRTPLLQGTRAFGKHGEPFTGYLWHSFNEFCLVDKRNSKPTNPVWRSRRQNALGAAAVDIFLYKLYYGLIRTEPGG